jgi:hypothetical protein
MSPLASDAQPAVVARAAVLEHLLHDEEVVLLAVKPSGWFVPLSSLPTLAVLAVGGHYLGGALDLPLGSRTVEVFCGALAALRLLAACCQWIGTLYVLTNQRVLRVRSALRIAILGCMLREVEQTVLSVGLSERVVGVGTLFFQTAKGNLAGGEWQHVARPSDVLAMINDAARRVK